MKARANFWNRMSLTRIEAIANGDGKKFWEDVFLKQFACEFDQGRTIRTFTATAASVRRARLELLRHTCGSFGVMILVNSVEGQPGVGAREEEGMRHRVHRGIRPGLEPFETRALLSGILTVMATTPLHSTRRLSTQAAAMDGSVLVANRFVPSGTSIALPTNQGPQGTNLALTPTGNLTRRELKREQFSATFTGKYAVGPGRTDTESQVTLIRGAGGSNQFLHGDLQIQIVKPTDPTVPFGGVLAIFDRNINSNSALGLDLTAPQGDADAAGRPNALSLSLDTNESSGVYDEGYAQGIVSIRYLPSARKTPGVISQGTAVVKIRAQIYTTGVDFILANSNINPGGPSQAGPRNHSIV